MSSTSNLAISSTPQNYGDSGAKRVRLGDDTYVYDAHNYLITSVHLSTVVQIIEASPEKPYLGLRLMLDQREISQPALSKRLKVRQS
jgi:hypothetical protein